MFHFELNDPVVFAQHPDIGEKSSILCPLDSDNGDANNMM
jgi:hypothetical protein